MLVDPNVGTTTPTLERKEVSGKREIDTEPPITTDTGNNRITDSGLLVDPNVGGNKLNPVTITGKREIEEKLNPVTITGKREIEEKLNPVTITGKREIEEKPAIITEPVITLPKITIPKITLPKSTDVVKTDTTVDTKKTTTPEEQLYQTTTQSNPTTPTDIKYFLDMIGSGILPPINKHDPVESLINPPMSLEELLHHLRS